MRVPLVRIDGVANGDGKRVSFTMQHEGWKMVVEALEASGGDLKLAPPPPGYLERKLAMFVPDLVKRDGGVAAAASDEA